MDRDGARRSGCAAAAPGAEGRRPNADAAGHNPVTRDEAHPMTIKSEWQIFERDVLAYGDLCPRLSFYAGATAMLKLVLRARSSGDQTGKVADWLHEIAGLLGSEP